MERQSRVGRSYGSALPGRIGGALPAASGFLTCPRVGGTVARQEAARGGISIGMRTAAARKSPISRVEELYNMDG